MTAVVSTGTDEIYLRRQLADELDLEYLPYPVEVGAPLSPGTTASAFASLELSGTEGNPLHRDVQATVLDFMNAPADIIIGMGVLKDYRLTFQPDGVFTISDDHPGV